MVKKIIAIAVLVFPLLVSAQFKSNLSETEWVDSVFKSLTPEKKLAQLMVIRAHSNLGPAHVAKVADEIKKYNVGALCFFQGGPVRQANLTNYYQSLAQTPIMVTIDGEWGLGMRLDSAIKFPYQITLGALPDDEIVYKMGLAVGRQCKRMGVHVNYAPVVDINNNPLNPVIGFRSFGENKDKVARLGVAYTRGMQDAGIMACAKHFPGHGDVAVDSHHDLPVVNKSFQQLSDLELVPFRAQVAAGVQSMMIAHLYLPQIDKTANKASSISKKSVTGILRDKLGYDGLTFTDALEMDGVAKYFPGGTIAVEALIAGNDMLCLPASVEGSIKAIMTAIEKKKLTWKEIDEKVKKVLKAKYSLGMQNMDPVETTNLVEDINSLTPEMNKAVAENAITVLTNTAGLPLNSNKAQTVAYVGIGTNTTNSFGKRIQNDLGADVYILSYSDSETRAQQVLNQLKAKNYDVIITGIHDFSNRPAKNYGISATAVNFWKKIDGDKTVTLLFGNPLAATSFCTASSLLVCYQDDAITQEAAADIILGKTIARGTLPLSVCKFKEGDGLRPNSTDTTRTVNVNYEALKTIDTIALEGIAKKAYPGCVVYAVKDGNVIFEKAYGTNTSGPYAKPMFVEALFDLASVTKVSATTMAIMRLYEEGKVDLKKTLGDYLPYVAKSNKKNITVEELLLHQGGLVSFIQFYKEIVNPGTGEIYPAYYRSKEEAGFSTRVAEGIYLRNDWQDTLMKRILESPLSPKGKYVYSDNDFIFLGKIVEQISGLTLDDYVRANFYIPMGMTTTGFKPRAAFPLEMIAPTENEPHFRRQLLWGDVHDEGCSLFGGIAGHAGLFSNAQDLAKIYQMLLNGGVYEGKRYLSPQTIQLFTAYGSTVSRRGLGFDKPEKDNTTRKEPYPSKSVSLATYGHTGFTGTCVWVDPKENLIFIFLSNRVYPSRSPNLLGSLDIRPRIQEVLYKAIMK